MKIGFLLPAGALTLAMILLLLGGLLWRIVAGVLIILVALGLAIKWALEAVARREMADLAGADPAADAWPPEPEGFTQPPSSQTLPATAPTGAPVGETRRAFSSKTGD